MEALEAARVPMPTRTEPLLVYLDDADEQWGLDLTLEVSLNGHTLSRPPFSAMYWSAAQQLAHMTVNGASVGCGDLYGSGTVSGPDKSEWGSMLELAWRGADPIAMPDGTSRAFLEDGDVLSVSATAPGSGGSVIGFGAVSGLITSA